MSDTGTLEDSTEIYWQKLGLWRVVLRSSDRYWASGRWYCDLVADTWTLDGSIEK